MTERSISSVGGGSRHPNPEYYGLDWPKVQKLLGELQDITARANENGRRIAELEEELKAEKAALPQRRAEALRRGEGGVPSNVERLEAQIREGEEKADDYKRAATLVDRDIKTIFDENGHEFLEDLERRRLEAETRVNELRAQLRVPEWELDAFAKIAKYVTWRPMTRAGMSFNGTPEKPEVSADVGAGEV